MNLLEDLKLTFENLGTLIGKELYLEVTGQKIFRIRDFSDVAGLGGCPYNIGGFLYVTLSRDPISGFERFLMVGPILPVIDSKTDKNISEEHELLGTYLFYPEISVPLNTEMVVLRGKGYQYDPHNKSKETQCRELEVTVHRETLGYQGTAYR